jgi:predicted XRE-type DNA-binding protein
MKRVPSPPVTPEIAAIIKRLIGEGLYQHQIASALGINQGRVSEVKTGKLHPKIPAVEQLPLNFG